MSGGSVGAPAVSAEEARRGHGGEAANEMVGREERGKSWPFRSVLSPVQCGTVSRKGESQFGKDGEASHECVSGVSLRGRTGPTRGPAVAPRLPAW